MSKGRTYQDDPPALLRGWWIAFLLFTLSAGMAKAADSFILISDVDDTVKITNVLHRADAFKNAVASEAVFAGMPELYHEILGKDSPAERLGFMSGSPGILRPEVSELLQHGDFPAYQLTLRASTELLSSPFGYKTKHLREMYGASAGEFLLVGDDTESDPEIYEAFSKGNQVRAIYVHRITGRALPPGSVVFVTAYDIAVHEFLAGHLSEEQAAAVGNAVFAAEDRNFLPCFQECPKEYEPIAGLSEPLAQLAEKIEVRMTALCSSRPNTCRSHQAPRL